MTWVLYGTRPEPGDLFVGALVVCATAMFVWKLFRTEKRP